MPDGEIFSEGWVPLALSMLFTHAYSGIDGIGWTLWDGWRRLDQIGWILGMEHGWDGWKKAEGMDSWFSYIP